MRFGGVACFLMFGCAALAQSGPTLTFALNGAGFGPDVSPASWVTITGTNLANTTRTWRADEIVNNKLPTQLDGVSVTINNQPAAVYYISPTQVNVLAPDNAGTGQVPVQLTLNGAVSNQKFVFVQPYAPASFLWQNRYAVATHTDFSLLGPPGLFPGLTTTPAKPSETIILWATGLGPVNPPVPSLQAAGDVGNVTVPVNLRLIGTSFGQVIVPAIGAAIPKGYAGLYQIAFTLPNNAIGDISVQIQIGGVMSGAALIVSSQQRIRSRRCRQEPAPWDFGRSPY